MNSESPTSNQLEFEKEMSKKAEGKYYYRMKAREFPKDEEENTSSGPTKCPGQNMRKNSYKDI